MILIAGTFSDAGWDIASFKACPRQERCPPEFACETAGACAPGERDPVCACDCNIGEYRYYENFCEYQVAKCSNPSKIRIGLVVMEQQHINISHFQI